MTSATRSLVEDILADLVAFPTCAKTPNGDLLRYVSNFLDKQGVASQIFWAADGRRGNLLASIGPRVPGGVILSGHTDVV